MPPSIYDFEDLLLDMCRPQAANVSARSRAAGTVSSAKSAKSGVEMREVASPSNAAPNAGKVARAVARVLVEVVRHGESNSSDDEHASVPVIAKELAKPTGTAC